MSRVLSAVFLIDFLVTNSAAPFLISTKFEMGNLQSGKIVFTDSFLISKGIAITEAVVYGREAKYTFLFNTDAKIQLLIDDIPFTKFGWDVLKKNHPSTTDESIQELHSRYLDPVSSLSDVTPFSHIVFKQEDDIEVVFSVSVSPGHATPDLYLIHGQDQGISLSNCHQSS